MVQHRIYGNILSCIRTVKEPLVYIGFLQVPSCRRDFPVTVLWFISGDWDPVWAGSRCLSPTIRRFIFIFPVPLTFPNRITELGFKKFILIKYGYMQYSIFLVLCILGKDIVFFP